ncbi:hypothetical protein AHAS_Ahas20G0311300 [Arachis hypogaea]
MVQRLVIPPLLVAQSFQPRHLSFRPGAMTQLSTWSGRASMVQPPTQTSVARTVFRHLDAPTRVTS